ncbi:hypothetical protein [Demequina sp. NBRC 110051]|uniref:hypothetical protein n=1 Tax=Demequina sp. NBRC 110051 TaxID=1570340 RepID=UPI00117E2EA5|nr:hypothetical protein [Demequina sp. NBRC 110051]
MRSTVFPVALDLDRDAGTPLIMFGWADVEAHTGEPPQTPNDEVADVAREISNLDPLALTSADVWKALVETVDDAAYWQPPRGEDVLAARPELDGALSRLATAVAEQDLLPPPDGEAYAVVHLRDGEPNTPWPTPSAAPDLLQGWTAQMLEGERAASRDRPRDARAPYSGTWWSTPPHGLVVSTPHSKAVGPWGLSLVEDGLGETEALTAPVVARPAARVYTIESAQDWASLCRMAPLEVTASKRHDWYRTTGRDDVRWVIPDWPTIAVEWDAVHLTLAGYLDLAGRLIDVYEGVASVIAGWNPGATYWFRGAHIERSATISWVRAESDKPWHQASRE